MHIIQKSRTVDSNASYAPAWSSALDFFAMELNI